MERECKKDKSVYTTLVIWSGNKRCSIFLKVLPYPQTRILGPIRRTPYKNLPPLKDKAIFGKK